MPAPEPGVFTVEYYIFFAAARTPDEMQGGTTPSFSAQLLTELPDTL